MIRKHSCPNGRSHARAPVAYEDFLVWEKRKREEGFTRVPCSGCGNLVVWKREKMKFSSIVRTSAATRIGSKYPIVVALLGAWKLICLIGLAVVATLMCGELSPNSCIWISVAAFGGSVATAIAAFFLIGNSARAKTISNLILVSFIFLVFGALISTL